MTQIFATSFTPTIQTLIHDIAASASPGQIVDAWLFNDATTRRAAEAELAGQGITARIRSAYKPLLHFFLEDLDLANSEVVGITVRYPRHENAADNRFLLETYPLAALVAPAVIRFEAGERNNCTYDVILRADDGSQTRHEVFAPNRVHRDMVNETHLSPTGWLRMTDADGNLVRDDRIETEYEALFSQTMSAIAGHDWGKQEPYFEELNITVDLPGIDQKIAHGHEVLSLHEALHEDFYFSLLEYFQIKSGRPLGDRGLQPGQIVPEIRQSHEAGDAKVTVELRPLSKDETVGDVQSLDYAIRPLTVAQIRAELDVIGGADFHAVSRSGRQLNARYHKGTGLPVMISGGQHPNEISGVAGALRGAQELAKRDGAHFTISPLENPDGYALHQRLIVDNPTHMHHAARYTALGDDMEYRSGDGLYEKEIRVRARAISGASLHINLHGYPSHEWTRPLSGYVPRGFDMWTLPKGFFLIMRHHDNWTDRAESFIDQVTRKLAAIPGLLEFNAAQINLYRIHAGETGFRIINGFPCMISIDDRHDVPLTLITEYPDETIYGDAFIAAHTAQKATVVAAYDAWQTLDLEKSLI
ncbi:M14 family metallopeptidase [Thalassospira alkalitolerans]|uniref:M14 family metallopeptidase n=1 Tax=Thalassospira alkalitolerans TaxID=1293890 RepID=UPI003AA8AAB1